MASINNARYTTCQMLSFSSCFPESESIPIQSFPPQLHRSNLEIQDHLGVGEDGTVIKSIDYLWFKYGIYHLLIVLHLKTH